MTIEIPVIATTIMMNNMPYTFHNASGNFDKSGIARLPFHLFVWLLATLWKNCWTDFHGIFRAGRWHLGQGTTWNIFGMFHLKPHTQDFLLLLFWRKLSVCNIVGQWLSRFSCNFHQENWYVTRNNHVHFGDVMIKPYNTGSISISWIYNC